MAVHSVERAYNTIVYGGFAQDEGFVESNLGRSKTCLLYTSSGQCPAVDLLQLIICHTIGVGIKAVQVAQDEAGGVADDQLQEIDRWARAALDDLIVNTRDVYKRQGLSRSAGVPR